MREPTTPAWGVNRSGLVAHLVEGTKLEVWEFCGDSVSLEWDLRGSHFRFNQPERMSIPCSLHLRILDYNSTKVLTHLDTLDT